MGRSPWTAADALVGLSRLSKALVLRTKERVQGTRAHQGVRAPLTSGDGTAGFGVVYKLDTAGQQTVLHSFAGGAAGAYPNGVIRDSAGNLYGTTDIYGPANLGVVYKLDAAGNETVLYTFGDGRFRCYRDTVRPCFYIPLAQTYGADLRYQVSRMNLEVRTTGDPARLAAGIRGEIHALDHALDEDMPARQAQTLESYRDAGLGQERLSAALLSGLGMLAALIAAIGLYGVLAFAVAQRTREIGIRMALGAASGQVLRSVLLDALGLVGAGIAIGFVGAMLLARLVSSLLYGVSSTDPATYAGVAGILIVVGALAAFLPARRASRVDPMVALRYE